MPLVNISITGISNSSASGVITDPAILAKLKEVQCHLQDNSHLDPEASDSSGAAPPPGI